MINYLSKINYRSIKLITCQNKLIADQKMIDYRGQNSYNIATADCRETLPHDRKLTEFYNASPKIRWGYFGARGNILTKLFSGPQTINL